MRVCVQAGRSIVVVEYLLQGVYLSIVASVASNDYFYLLVALSGVVRPRLPLCDMINIVDAV